ncbi:methyltransferase domain-containing protein [Leifsonia shinshuensis]|uniref:class I SAM-dependent methyltransferase n=1 Tax=Leifsonia shinshuensis TaxID=150026 RepID=UPI001F50D2F5|nr:methyltransferase domain-containing protein [Leifsonia shinshuensis]MCI0156414.1 methyltransferase domain-containing protein [Leifsonia shinshuensis]
MTFDRERDVVAYDRRAGGYERGPRGLLHREIARRVGVLAVSLVAGTPAPRILDVGCGSGALLRFVGALRPDARLTGVDPAPEMVRAASSPRLAVVQASAERLPFEEGAFDLVVSSTSFSHWEDRDAGLRECRRVLAAGGGLLLADVFTSGPLPTRLFGPGGAAASRETADAAIRTAGFAAPRWRPLFASVIQAAVATT